jgi:hypothetical protein
MCSGTAAPLSPTPLTTYLPLYAFSSKANYAVNLMDQPVDLFS